MDEVVAIEEVLHLDEVSKHECFIFKVEFKKVYHSVNWSFIDYMLHRYNFDSRWMAWM